MLKCGCSSGGSTGQLRLVIQSLAALVCRSGILTPVRLTESSAGEWGMHNSIVSELVHTPAQAPDVFVLIPASSFLTLSSYLGVTHFFCILFKEAQLEALVQLQFPDMPHLMEMLPGGMQLIQQTGHLSGKAQCVTWQQQAHRVCLTFHSFITSDLNVMAGFLWIEPTVHYVCLLHCCVTAVFSTAGAQVGNKTAPACV